MPLIKVIKNDIEFHLEMWNEEDVKGLGLQYEIIPIDKDFTLNTIDELKK